MPGRGFRPGKPGTEGGGHAFGLGNDESHAGEDAVGVFQRRVRLADCAPLVAVPVDGFGNPVERFALLADGIVSRSGWRRRRRGTERRGFDGGSRGERIVLEVGQVTGSCGSGGGVEWGTPDQSSRGREWLLGGGGGFGRTRPDHDQFPLALFGKGWALTRGCFLYIYRLIHLLRLAQKSEDQQHAHDHGQEGTKAGADGVGGVVHGAGVSFQILKSVAGMQRRDRGLPRTPS